MSEEKFVPIPQAEINRVLKETRLSPIVARYVEFSKEKRGWACCPFHQEKSPSFHVRGERFKCFGCGEGGDVIAFVMLAERLNFRQAYLRLADAKPALSRPPRPQQPRHEKPVDIGKHAAALALWEEAEVITGSLAETYLRARGIRGDLSGADLRFHPSAPAQAYSPERSDRHPAMVAAIRKPTGEIIGAHVTYLAADGMRKADMKPARKVYGKQDGGVIFLAPVAERMVLGEGVESSLSASEIVGRPAIAAVCSGNMKKLAPIDGVSDWLVAYDRDANQIGYKAGQSFALKARAAGLAVRALPPPRDVKDWNDAAQRRV